MSNPRLEVILEGPASYIASHGDQVLTALTNRDLKPEVFYHSAQNMQELSDHSIQLVVTSPPYPMIEMWDLLFERELMLSPQTFVSQPDPFTLAHNYLAKIWAECFRVLEQGGILCVNIGDATRTIDGNFKCYSNHVRVTEICEQIGFQSLVPILWKKPTNKPNAFLGSGFYPPNAYVTLDCEYILVFRKGAKRVIKPQDPLRYASQYAKAERDVWFSQTWDLRGERQNHAETAPFPEELPYRLIRMFSCIGDTVLDPFLGTGTTVKVARLLGRKGIGYEMNSSLKSLIDRNVDFSPARPEEVVDYLFRIYETAQDAPTVLVTSKTRNLSDKSLSSFR